MLKLPIRIIRINIFVLLVVFLFYQANSFVNAEEFTFAQKLILSHQESISGDIITRNKDNQFVRSSTPFDESMIGVLANNATIVFHPIESDGSSTIVTSGQARVNVTTLNGPIVVGDRITSSTIPGKAQKATDLSGYILGIALENFSEESNGEKITVEGRTMTQGSILIAINIGPIGPLQAGAVTKLVDQIGSTIFQNIQTPERADRFFRYFIAGLIALVAILVSFTAFGKNISRGIEAIGRNPLAKTQIQAMIIINVGLIAAITIGAVILSLAIVRF